MNQESVARILVADRAKLLAYLRSIVRDHTACEDLFQDVLVLAIEKCAEINDGPHVLRWARQTARFRAIDFLRRKGLEPVSFSGQTMDQLELHWQQLDAEANEPRLAALARCMKKVSRYSRTLLIMRFGQGLSGAEIAAQTHRKPHAVYTALSRTYRVLAKCIDRELQEGASHD